MEPIRSSAITGSRTIRRGQEALRAPRLLGAGLACIADQGQAVSCRTACATRANRKTLPRAVSTGSLYVPQPRGEARC